MTSRLPVGLLELRARLARFGPPIIVFNKSHSGSRLLAQVLSGAGVFMGAEVNESEDSLPVFEMVEYLVKAYYPDFSRFFREADTHALELLDDVFRRHLDGFPGGRWGWKLCETGYVLPVVAALFPEARYVHLLRDGRDVAFSDHVAPRSAFWKKVYFNTDRIRRWHGLPLSSTTYRLISPLYNARHWANSVTVGRLYGAMAGERYREVRFEGLVLDFERTVRDLLAELDLPFDEQAMGALQATLRPDRIGRHRRESRFRRWLAARELEPALSAFGYGTDDRDAP